MFRSISCAVNDNETAIMIGLVIGFAVSFAVHHLWPMGRVARRFLFLACVTAGVLIPAIVHVLTSDRC